MDASDSFTLRTPLVAGGLPASNLQESATVSHFGRLQPPRPPCPASVPAKSKAQPVSVSLLLGKGYTVSHFGCLQLPSPCVPSLTMLAHVEGSLSSPCDTWNGARNLQRAIERFGAVYKSRVQDPCTRAAAYKSSRVQEQPCTRAVYMSSHPPHRVKGEPCTRDGYKRNRVQEPCTRHEQEPCTRRVQEPCIKVPNP